MKKIRIITVTVLLLSIGIYSSSPASAEKKPWERTIVGKVIEIDKKYDILTVEVKKTEGFFKRVKTVKIPIRVRAVKDINIGDAVNIDYEMTASAGNVAERIEVARSNLPESEE